MKKKQRPYRRPTVEQVQVLMRKHAEATKMKPVVVAVKKAVKELEHELRAQQ